MTIWETTEAIEIEEERLCVDCQEAPAEAGDRCPSCQAGKDEDDAVSAWEGRLELLDEIDDEPDEEEIE